VLLAKIVGTVVATRGKPEGSYLVAVDTVDAGVGETVLIVSGSSARMASGLKDCPVDAAIVGIIDAVELSE
jgi:microcompartment protein CcmK/EutM